MVLAAGKGKRMKSDLPKVFHALAGKPLLAYVLESLEKVPIRAVAIVIGHRGELIRDYFKGRGLVFVEQTDQLGTGHAMLQAAPFWKDHKGTLVVLNGDVPLIRPETIRALCESHEHTHAAATVLTTEIDNPTGYGRIVRKSDGTVARIVEHRDATGEEKKIREINTGAFCFSAELLLPVLQRIQNKNDQGEYYLTDTLQQFLELGEHVGAYPVLDFHEVSGINTAEELEGLEEHIQSAT